MATIAYRTFVDVYDDTDNYYDIILPKSLWEKLCNQFESTSCSQYPTCAGWKKQ